MGDENTRWGGTMYKMDGDEWHAVGEIVNPDGITLSCDEEKDAPDLHALLHDEVLGSVTFRASRSDILALKALVRGGKYRKNYEKAQRRSRNNSRRKH